LLIVCCALVTPNDASEILRVWRVGISLSLSGTFPPDLSRGVLVPHKCTYCASVKQTLDIWRDTVNSGQFHHANGVKMSVFYELRDDASDSRLCRQNYERMANDSNVHFLLGPAYAPWNSLVAEIAEKAGKVLILWAFDFTNYYTTPTLHNITLGSSADAGAYDLANTRRLLFANDEVGVCEGGGTVRAGSGCGIKMTTNDGGPPSRRLWDPSYRYTFDLNIQDDRWSIDAIDRIMGNVSEHGRKSGAEGFSPSDVFLLMFAWFDDFPDSEVSRSRCFAYYQYFQEKFASTSRASRLQPMFAFDYNEDIMIIKDANPKVIFFCGNTPGLSLFKLKAKAASFSPSALLLDRPVQPGSLAPNGFLDAVMLNYVVEPLPISVPIAARSCPVFGSYAEFTHTLQVLAKNETTYGSLQSGAAGVLAVMALTGQESDNITSESIAQFFRTQRIDTFLGTFAFTEAGERRHDSDAHPGTRQFMPQLGSNQSHLESKLMIVSGTAQEACGTSETCRARYSPHLSLSPSWVGMELEIFVCPNGCKQLGGMCVPCKAGLHRSAQDRTCRPCLADRYADVEGCSACKACPKGASCANASNAPLPEKYYYLFSTSESTSAGCPRQPTTYRFAPCRPKTLCRGGNLGCVGTNMGMVCGQCPKGSVSFGLLSGMRRCKRCPERHIVIIAILFCILPYVILLFLLSSYAVFATRNPSTLECALLRSVLHYVQLFSCTMELTKLDALPFFAYVLTPLDILYRPLELSMSVCLFGRSEIDSLTSVEHHLEFARLLMPAGIACVAAGHLLRYLFRWLMLGAEVVETGMMGLAKVVSRNTHFEGIASMAVPGGGSQAESEDDSSPGARAVLPAEARHSQAGEDVQYSRILGPGQKFARMHEQFKVAHDLCDFVRDGIIWVMLIYPASLRGAFQAQRCSKLYFSSRKDAEEAMFYDMNYDLDCSSDVVKRLSRVSMVGKYVYIIGLPVLLCCFLTVFRTELWNPNVRRVASVLFDGYRPPCYFWEAIKMLRVAAFFACGGISALMTRCSLLVLITLFFGALDFFASPFEPVQRHVLRRFERFEQVSLLSVIICGLAVQMDIDPRMDAALQTSALTQNFTIVCVFLILIGTMLYALLALISATITIPLQIMLVNGAYVSSSTRFFHWLSLMFRNLNRITYAKDKTTGTYFIDISQLNMHERKFLVLTLTDTISACLDSGPKFFSWKVERAIHEAFLRALNARAANNARSYESWGMTTHPLSSVLRFLQVTFRDPDIQQGGGNERENEGITVEELYTALRDVDLDVLEHHPRLHYVDAQESDVFYKDDGMPNDGLPSVTWDPAEPLDSLEMEMHCKGSMMVRHNSAVEIEGEAEGTERQKKPRFLKDFTREVTKQMRLETEEVRRQKLDHNRLLEERLRALVDEVVALRQKIGLGEGDDFGNRSFEDEGDAMPKANGEKPKANGRKPKATGEAVVLDLD